MSKIDDLIRELCPEGVPTRLVGDLFAYEQPTRYLVDSADYVGSGTPVLTAGQTFLLGHTLEEHGIYPATPDSPVIIFDDFTTGFQWVDFPFKAKSSAMKMISPRSGERVELRFLYHWMGVRNFQPGEHARHWISVYSQFEIPTPPLEVQREIVAILDKFTQLEAELEAELEARRIQYEETRNNLLNFDQDPSYHPLSEMLQRRCPEGVAGYRLGSVLRRRKGVQITAGKMKTLSRGDAQVRVFAGGQTLVDVDSDQFPKERLISEPGIIVKSRGHVEFAYWESSYTHKSEIWSYTQGSSEVDVKFVYYLLKSKTKFFQDLARSKSVKMPQLSVGDTDDFLIPVPPLEVQREIVSILDKLDALVNDISYGLPAEIAARRKQYEYYRNKLLTFKELDAA